MIELNDDALVFSFPQVHPKAKLRIEFQRTLRIPDDGNDYPLPPGLGRFPLRHVDDFTANVPAKWIDHGGIVLPMYQSEAMWLNSGSWLAAMPALCARGSICAGLWVRRIMGPSRPAAAILPNAS